MTETQKETLLNNLHLSYSKLSKCVGTSIYLLQKYMKQNGIKKKPTKRLPKPLKRKAKTEQVEVTATVQRPMKRFKKVKIDGLKGAEILIGIDECPVMAVRNYKNAILRGKHKSVSKSLLEF